MTPNWGQFPFCNAPLRSNAERGQNLWPAAFTAAEIMDVYRNWKTIDFNIKGLPASVDARIAIDQAASTLNTGQLLALDVAVDMALAGAGNRDSVVGRMERRTDSSQCTGVKFVYNKSLCYIELSFYPVIDARSGKTLPGVVRVPRANNYLYHPRFLMVFWASGSVFSNSPLALYGYGTCEGTLNFVGGSGFIGGGIDENDVYYAPTGTTEATLLSDRGFHATERVDEIVFSPRSAAKGATVILSGATFDANAVVSIGRTPAQAVVAPDCKSISLAVPGQAPREPIIVATSRCELVTREYFQPA